jgi:hypothetical protein
MKIFEGNIYRERTGPMSCHTEYLLESIQKVFPKDQEPVEIAVLRETNTSGQPLYLIPIGEQLNEFLRPLEWINPKRVCEHHGVVHDLPCQHQIDNILEDNS